MVNRFTRQSNVDIVDATIELNAALDPQDWDQNSSGIADIAEPEDYFGASLIGGDFNGDGFDDLAIGVPFEDLGSVIDVGVVHVLRGSNTGITGSNDQYLHQNITGIVDEAEEDDLFGSSLAAGDFNGDGFDDLAIGVDGESVGSILGAGAVHVFRGTTGGLTFTGDQLWHQNSSGVNDVAEDGDSFGEILTVGDFNGDGFDDLAIGIPFEDIGLLSGAGAVAVLGGSNTGLTAANDQFWNQNSANVQGDAETGDLFGEALAAGDFNGDGYDDLAIGAFLEDIEPIEDAGVVHVLNGSATGLTAANNDLWYQDRPGVQGDAEAGDGFGSSLAVGDFNGDGYDDLAVGVAQEDIGSVVNAGAVHEFRGSSNGLTTTGNQLWYEDRAGVEGDSEAGDLFGGNLAVGDFNGDGFDDLVVTKGTQDQFSDESELHILFGSQNGLTTVGDSVILIAQTGNVEVTLGVSDFNNDGFDDLAVGVPGTSIGPNTAAGSAYVLFGSADGL